VVGDTRQNAGGVGIAILSRLSCEFLLVAPDARGY